MYQINKFFVHFWLAISIATFIYALYEVYTLGWEKGSPNFFIPIIAFFWWLFRRGVTRRMEKKMREGNNR